jgi:hypothetical protein
MPRKTQESVVEELQRRARKGHSLRSGDNRGDWLYAGAVRFFGSWRAAVEASGFDYDEVVWRPLTADQVITRIQELADAGDALLAKDHEDLIYPARRHFGSWKAAVEAADRKNPTRMKWPAEKVIEAIRDDMAKGLDMGANATRRRNENLYAAGRRRFGSWAAALETAADQNDSSRRRRKASKKGRG